MGEEYLDLQLSEQSSYFELKVNSQRKYEMCYLFEYDGGIQVVRLFIIAYNNNMLGIKK